MNQETPTNPAMMFLTCQQIERTCSAIYREFARRLEKDVQACTLFLKMAQEEDEHAAKFELLYPIAAASSVTLNIGYSYATSALREVENLLQKVREAPRLSLGEALRLSVKAEVCLQVFHAEMAVEVRNEEWHALVLQLNEADLDHTKRLRDFQQRRNLDP